ncbi:hypothetical protein TIA1EST31_06524 [Cutibacterium acnes FZ1/2/0]|nr:hypothetical protein TIA1EST31_06524 [Cutibacterium acnes FZ1/2/0]KFC15843.1 hypothetical protein PAST3_10878 [Cutibacterium acnes HL201PA1]MCP2377421.1 hypothetical protein [Cutibacterium modestum 31N]
MSIKLEDSCGKIKFVMKRLKKLLELLIGLKFRGASEDNRDTK